MSDDSLFNDLLSRITLFWKGLPDKPDESPDYTLRALWLHAAGALRTLGQVECDRLPALDTGAHARLQALVAERVQGVPLAYLIGRQSFMGLELQAGRGAMIPRRETEILGHAALNVLRLLVKVRERVMVMDICTGSGNLALALAFHEPHCTVLGTDLSSEAVAIARRNASHLNLANRVRFCEGDLFAPLDSEQHWGKIDLVVCNPPYISARQVDLLPHEIIGFEPRLAFDGGPFGVSVLSRFLHEAPRFLRPHSWLGFEVGLGQGQVMVRKLETTGKYRQVRGHRDGAGQVRAVLAQV